MVLQFYHTSETWYGGGWAFQGKMLTCVNIDLVFVKQHSTAALQPPFTLTPRPNTVPSCTFKITYTTNG